MSDRSAFPRPGLERPGFVATAEGAEDRCERLEDAERLGPARGLIRVAGVEDATEEWLGLDVTADLGQQCAEREGDPGGPRGVAALGYLGNRQGAAEVRLGRRGLARAAMEHRQPEHHGTGLGMLRP